MRSNTLVYATAFLATIFPGAVLAQDYYTTPSITIETLPTGPTGSCPIYKNEVPPCLELPPDCVTLACIQLETRSVPCGCPPPATFSGCNTYCPTGCSTSYVTATTSCSTISISKIPPAQPTPAPPTPPPSYSNSSITRTTKTETKTETTIITLTTCPASVTCTGQTTVYTSTEPCPTTTCTCLLPIVKFSTTLIAGQTHSTSAPPPPASTSSAAGGSTSTAPAPSPSASIIEANVAAGTWGAGMGSVGAGLLGFLIVLVWGMA